LEGSLVPGVDGVNIVCRGIGKWGGYVDGKMLYKHVDFDGISPMHA
jgi:hypothetical protein